MVTTVRAGAVEAAAEAIWRKDPFKMGDPNIWTGEGDQSPYRDMATAAIAAIDAEARSSTALVPLQNEWGDHVVQALACAGLGSGRNSR